MDDGPKPYYEYNKAQKILTSIYFVVIFLVFVITVSTPCSEFLNPWGGSCFVQQWISPFLISAVIYIPFYILYKIWDDKPKDN